MQIVTRVTTRTGMTKLTGVTKVFKLTTRLTRVTRKIFQREGWLENWQTCEIANIQFRSESESVTYDHQCKRCWRIWKDAMSNVQSIVYWFNFNTSKVYKKAQHFVNGKIQSDHSIASIEPPPSVGRSTKKTCKIISDWSRFGKKFAQGIQFATNKVTIVMLSVVSLFFVGVKSTSLSFVFVW